MKLVLTNSISTAEETAASEVVLDACLMNAFTLQHFMHKSFYKINVLHFFKHTNKC